MKKNLPVLVFVLFFISFLPPLTFAKEMDKLEEGADNTLVLSDFTFRGLNPNQELPKNKDSIIKNLGEPLRIEYKSFLNDEKISPDKKPNRYRKYYYYQGFFIETIINCKENLELIALIVIEEVGHETSRGIAVRDSVEKIFYQYGKTDRSIGDLFDSYSYYLETETYNFKCYYGLTFFCKDEKVIKIIYSLSFNNGLTN